MDSTELASALRTAISTLHKGFRKHMAAANVYSMTELQTISNIYRSPNMLPTELAALAHITPQSMSQILSKLEEQDLIKRVPSTSDKRKVFISITAAGKKLVEKTRLEGDAWLNEAIESTLTAKDKEQLLKTLPVLHKLIEVL